MRIRKRWQNIGKGAKLGGLNCLIVSIMNPTEELLTATFAADEFDLKRDWQIKEELARMIIIALLISPLYLVVLTA